MPTAISHTDSHPLAARLGFTCPHALLPTLPFPRCRVILGKPQASYNCIPLIFLPPWLCVDRCLRYSFLLPSVPGGPNVVTFQALPESCPATVVAPCSEAAAFRWGPPTLGPGSHCTPVTASDPKPEPGPHPRRMNCRRFLCCLTQTPAPEP